MKFGVCGGPEMGQIAKQAGFDYFEWSVGGLLHPREDEPVFIQALEQARAVELPCPAVNVFLPGDLKLTGPQVDWAAIETYLHTALRRAEQAGIEVIVFGSGGARRIPDGFDRQHAWDQLVRFGRLLGPIAADHGVTIALEPLNQGETNVINTVTEGAKLVKDVQHPAFRLLVDGYHWAKDGETAEGIMAAKDLLVHAHTATVEGRRPPTPEDDCAPFMITLKQAGYDGRVSIEGNITDPAIELPRALAVMKAQIH